MYIYRNTCIYTYVHIQNTICMYMVNSTMVITMTTITFTLYEYCHPATVHYWSILATFAIRFLIPTTTTRLVSYLCYYTRLWHLYLCIIYVFFFMFACFLVHVSSMILCMHVWIPGYTHRKKVKRTPVVLHIRIS